MLEVTAQDIDPFENVEISELMSRYAIAFRDGDEEEYTKVYTEVMKRMRALKDLQYKLKNITL